MNNRSKDRVDTDVFVFIHRGRKHQLCQALDVSRNGARVLQIDPPLKLQQSVELEFEPPNHEAFRVSGVVVRMADDETVGIQFQDVSEAQENALLYVMSDEKRYMPRTSIDFHVFVQKGSQRILTQARDLSRGGIRLDLPVELNLNPLDVVVLEFDLTVDEQDHSFHLGAKALREHDGGAMSFEFLAVSEHAARLLDIYVTEQGWSVY